MSQITTWAEKFGGRSLRAQAMLNPSFAGDRTLPGDGLSDAAAAAAIVSASRWIAVCPQPGCDGAEYVNFDDPRFFCCECRNAAWGNLPVSVVVPDDQTRASIESVLLLRPVPKTRNWTTQTVDELIAENEQAGDPIP